MASIESRNSSSPWYAAYPDPKDRNPAGILRQDVLEMLKQGNSSTSKDFVLVDLRRNDHQVPCSNS
jgi:arsenical-resistance protein 2